MGSLESKSRGANIERHSKDVAAAEQQENGHVKTNGDAPAKENGDTAPSNGSAESAPEDVISPEAAPSANGDPKPEDPSGKATKKKRFSFKKQFKLPFRNKTKKEAAAVEAPPADEAAPSPSAKEEESSPPEEQAEPVVVEAEPAEKPTPEAEVPPSDATDAQPEPATPEETPKPAESAPTTEPTTEPQKEE